MNRWLRRHAALLGISSLGFFYLFVYLYYDYSEHGAGEFIRHLGKTNFDDVLMHVMVFLAPIITTVIGIMFEKILHYKDRLELLVEERTASLKASEERARQLSLELEDKVKERTKRLEESARYWKDTFDSSPYGIFIIDKQFNILRLNRYIANLLGRTYPEIEGRKCYELFHGLQKPVKSCPVVTVFSPDRTITQEFYEPLLNRHLLLQVSPVALEDGVDAFVHSIVDITELKEKERSLEKSRDAFLNMLNDIHESYGELKGLFLSLIRAFIHALDAKSQWTKGHSERVTMYATQIAEEMGINKEGIEDLRVAGLLHDIGKIGTYDYLLDKIGRLTPEEFDIVRQHPVTAINILRDIKQLDDIVPVIRHHHERFDGKGYPDGLRGEDIPIGARILCVADSFDSMTADRPYRLSLGIEYAKSELKRCSGTQFDPEVVAAFVKILGEEWEKIDKGIIIDFS